MASPYVLPSAALPHAHSHHMHSHSHSQSQSSLHSWKSSISSGGPNAQLEEESHEHGHSHHRSPSHGRASSQASNTGAAMASRGRRVPASLDSLDGWTQEKTAGGRSIVTPGLDSVSMPYSPPTNHGNYHDHDHGHDHGHIYAPQHAHAHAHAHHHHHHHDHDRDISKERSAFTKMLLPYTAHLPILHAIMTEKDSRRIFYFMALNFAFMAVQAFYGYVTDSLGLLSDSIHMFFDCVALCVGLLAAVLSKWPPSQKFPYGFGKIETLSGFANGILLMLLSVEIAFEAFERLWEGTQTKRLGELFVVSTLGLIVNLVGMMAFGHHHHHGHDHGHSHGHSHSHGAHDHDCGSHGGHSHGHGHSHDNENMHGIYLHILADTMGSASVIVSTLLTSVWGWAGWDPLASCLIAALIFLSAKPLVSSSAKRLLLSVSENTEYNLRNTLGGILQQRSVVGYSTPKFWLDDRGGSDTGDRLVGIVHVTAARGASLDDVRGRVRGYLLNEGVNAVVQVEREGDNGCWCTRGRAPITPQTPKPF